MDNIIVSDNNNAFVPNEQPSSVHEQAPVLIQENILQDGGIAATIDVGSTTTLEPSSPAYVRNIGDEKHAVLQFGIPKGETGQAGTDGVDGSAATIQIGSVETVDSSSDANVVNVGTENAAVLNFSIPRGEQGIQGEQGYSPVAYVSPIQGGARIHIADSQTETDVDVMDGQDGAAGQAATITVGSTTTGAAGTNASVVNSGTSSAAVFDFTIPRGADGQDGQDGQDGADGQAATITVGSTTTGAAGTNASVVNSGTSSAAVLDFTIPRGADGQNGQDGTDGTDGFSPIASVSQTSSGATITITDAQGTTTANISNGTNGTDGTDGTDGFSPIATVSQGTGSATISITDINGTTTATVYDGTSPSLVQTTGQSTTDAMSQKATTDALANKQDKNVFSTSEQVIGTWVNNKPLYRKTINFGTLPNNTTKNVAHGISNLSFVIHAYGMAKSNVSSNEFPVPFASTSSASSIYLFVSPTNITIGTGSNRSDFDTCYITLEYIKTTD